MKNQLNIALILKEIECSTAARLTKTPTVGVKRKADGDNDDKAKIKKTKKPIN